MPTSTVLDRDNDTTATGDQRPDGPGHETTATRARRPGGPGHGGSGLARVTVNLINRASRALELVVKLTGDSRTDSINRALQVYAYVLQADANGGGIYVRESQGSELQRLKMS